MVAPSADITADRSSDGSADDAFGIAEDGVVLVGDRRLEQLAVPCHGADRDVVAIHADIRQIEVVDVDEMFRSGESKFHHRQQAVTACHQPCFRPEPIQERDGVVDAGRSLVLERRWNLHEIPRSLASRVARPQTNAVWLQIDHERIPSDRQLRPKRRVISTPRGLRSRRTVPRR
jgi:hypothetical protein